jgi:phosphoglycerate dehydrogenase-like enzyme
MSASTTKDTEITEPRVLLLYKHPEEIVHTLRARFPALQFHVCTRYADLPDAVASFQPHVAFASRFEPDPFPREALIECPSLRWLSLGVSGIDHVTPWSDDHLVVTNAAGVAAEEMAEYVLGAIFGLFQRIPYFARRQAEHVWDYRQITPARGATIGIVGLGRTGEAVARLCKLLGFPVFATRASEAHSENVDEIFGPHELHDMLAEVDVTVACAALTGATQDMFGADAFAAMRPGSYFINVGRGGLVVEEALVEALRSGHLGGAVIDVTRVEPLPADSPLWDAPNLLITPHTSSEFAGWEARAAMMFADNLERWLKGEALHNRVFSARGY